jgi:hypothetical protein
MAGESERNSVLTDYERRLEREAEEGLRRNERKPFRHFYDTIGNAAGITKGAIYIWSDHDGSYYSNVFADTKTIEDIFATQVKWNNSSATSQVKLMLANDAAFYQNEVKAGRGNSFHVLHVSTKITDKQTSKGTVTAREVYNIMCGSVKDYVAPAQSDEQARFNPHGPDKQRVNRINLYGLTSDNPVSSTAYLSLHLFVNETILGHLLHPGKIYRFITETNTAIYSNTIGLGNAHFLSDAARIALKKLRVSERSKKIDQSADFANNKILDNIIGARIFKSQDMRLKKEVQRRYNPGIIDEIENWWSK